MRNVRPVFGCVTQHIQPPSFGLVHSVIVIYSMSQLSHAVWMTIIGPPCEQANRFVKSSCFRACKTCTYRDISRSTRQKCFGRNMWCEHNILSVGTVKRNRKLYTPLMLSSTRTPPPMTQELVSCKRRCASNDEISGTFGRSTIHSCTWSVLAAEHQYCRTASTA